PDTIRLIQFRMVVTAGDAVVLLPLVQAPPEGYDLPAVRRKLSAAIGNTWTSQLLTIVSTEPRQTVAIRPSTTVNWYDDSTDSEVRTEIVNNTTTTATTGRAVPTTPRVTELIGSQQAARTLREWLDLALYRPELLTKLGATAQLGVLLTGSEGVGKKTLVHAVGEADGIPVAALDAADLVLLDSATARGRIAAAAEQAAATRPGIVLLSDIDTMLPATARPPSATVLLQQLRDVLQGTVTPHACAVIATTAHPESVDARLKTPDLLDRELALPMPAAQHRIELLRILLRDTPLQ